MIVLNKYLAKTGVCSRRKAVVYIQKGLVTVDGVTVKNPFHRVQEQNVVMCEGTVQRIPAYVYIILHKPLGYVTTCADEHGRPTVLDLVKEVPVRVYPVGRLDRDTSGLLLLTNDGQLAQSLMHPRFEVQKTYIITLDTCLSVFHEEQMRQGSIVLHDGPVIIDSLHIINNKRTHIRLLLHSGKNRIIRRLFAACGIVIMTLHREQVAQICIDKLSIGSWRYVTNIEIASLTHYTQPPLPRVFI